MPDHEHTLQCMEVWGGNQAVDSSVHLAGLDAWVYSKPYQEEDGGGDVYYVSSCATGRITRLLVADVAGHGNAVAELAVALRKLMRQHVNHLDQVKFVQRMNEALVEQSKVGSFATAVVTTFFAPTRSLSLCNAGHPPPLIYRANERAWSYVEHTASPSVDLADVPLGIVGLADYQQFDVTLEPDDLVVCYTDSLPEARLGDGELLGMEGLLSVANQVTVDAPTTLIPRLVGAIETHCGRPIAGDDITLLLFKPNMTTARVGIKDRLLSPWRVTKGAIASLARREWKLPLPDLNVANLLGTMFPALEKRRKNWQKRSS